MRALHLDPPEAEILEAGVAGGLRMAGEEAPPCRLVIGGCDAADEAHPADRQRIARPALVEEQRHPWIGGDVHGVAGEARQQRHRCPVHQGGNAHERRVGRAAGQKRRQRPGARLADQAFRHSFGVEFGGHRASPAHKGAWNLAIHGVGVQRRKGLFCAIPGCALPSHFGPARGLGRRGDDRIRAGCAKGPGDFMPTIALVDDDRNILTSVSIALEAEGYRILTYTDGASALDGFKTNPPDLAILDIKMPRMDGMELLRRLRQKTDLPVIFLTSKDEEIDELFGLKMGADDFIRKPFSQRLLVERVKAVLRRSAPKDPTAVPKETDAKALDRGLLRMDPERHTCTWKNEPVTLTVTEFLILQALARRPGVVKSRNALMDAAYDDQVYVDDRTIDSHIKRLRKKFKASDDDFDMIETLYGVGYRFKEIDP